MECYRAITTLGLRGPSLVGAGAGLYEHPGWALDTRWRSAGRGVRVSVLVARWTCKNADGQAQAG